MISVTVILLPAIDAQRWKENKRMRCKKGETSYKTLKALEDIAKIFFVGLAGSLAFFLVLFAGGYLWNERSAMAGLELAKNGLFLIAALLLFILAGMLIIKGKKPEKVLEDNGWRKHFQVIGSKIAIFILSVSFVLCASLVDYIMLRQ